MIVSQHILSCRLQTALTLAVILGGTLNISPALAQATDAQRSAIRASCRSDFMSNCSGVQPGGMAAFQCLQQNMAKLSAACKSAVSAVTPKTEPAPEKTEAPKVEPPKAETPKVESPKAEPSPAKPGAAPSHETKPSTQPKPAMPPKTATAKPPAGAKPAASSAPQTDAAPPPAAIVLRPMRPLEELRVLRSACGPDARILCGDVQPGGGRVLQCLAAQAASLSPMCKDVLTQFAVQ